MKLMDLVIQVKRTKSWQLLKLFNLSLQLLGVHLLVQEKLKMLLRTPIVGGLLPMHQ